MSPTSRNRRQRAVAIALVVAVFAACTDDKATTPSTTRPLAPPTTAPDGTPAEPGDASEQMALRLSQGQAVQTAPDPLTVVTGTELDPAAQQAVIDRLPPFTDDPDLTDEFRWPAETLRPPRVGATIDVPFPPPADRPPEVVDSGPVEVLRVQPEGDVPIAPFVSITFNQPMVPIGTLGQLDAAEVPATIEPETPGRWQWIGTRTLRFDAEVPAIDRLPMATEYTVTVPAGTAGDSGGTLAADETFTFRTPPVNVLTLSPQGENLPLQPVFVATFDQRIDPAAVLATVVLRAGDAPVQLRQATAAEIEADEMAKNLVASAAEGRWLAFLPVDPLPPATEFAVDVGPGTPSAEGPLTTATARTFNGRTYDPLRITSVDCESAGCTAGQQVGVYFNNPLDPASIAPTDVRVDPQLANGRVFVTPFSIVLTGFADPDREYTITIPGALTDVYGQRLGDDQQRTIRIGVADPQLLEASMMVTLDPLAPDAGISALSISHDELRVRVYRVSPDDWPSFVTYYDNRDTNLPVALPDWPELSDATVPVNPDGLRWDETFVPVAELLGGAPGHVVVMVEATRTYPKDSPLYWQNRPIVSWVQSTAIGVDAIADADEALVWTTDLRDGSVITDATLSYRTEQRATDATGLATFDLPATFEPSAYLVASRGSDSAILGSTYWSKSTVTDEARWHSLTDRGTYRPGETANIKGWVRRFTSSTDGRLRLLGDGAVVAWFVNDAQGVELAKGESPLTALGGFELEVSIPEGANLGPATVQYALLGEPGLDFTGGSTSLSIQEFRRPEFEVVARVESPAPHVSTGPATVAVQAAYFAGGALAAAPVNWQVTTSKGSYTPPDWDEFTFGVFQPWWYEGDAARGGFDDSFEPCCFPEQEQQVSTFDGTTDGSGTHYLQIDFEGADGALPDLPVTVRAQGTVTDLNRQAWASTTNLLVHAARLYVGLRGTRTFVEPGQAMDIEAIVTDIDGAPVAGRALTVTAVRLEWQYVDGAWKDVEVDPQTCEVTSAADPVTCSFTTSVGGTYTIRSVVEDDQGGRNRTELTRWVSGGQARPARNVEQEQLTVVPDRDSYQPGDTAQVLVQAPFVTGSGLAVVTRNGIETTIQFQVVGGSAVVDIPIGDVQIPGVDVQIEVVGATPRTADDGSALPDAPPRPAYAVAALSLPVPPTTRTLRVSAEPQDATAQPGQQTAIDVTVNDATGNPVEGAEFTVVVADEAVLALSQYSLANPLDSFYQRSFQWLNTVYGRSSIELVDPDRLVPDTPDGGDSPSETTAGAGEQETADDAGDFAVAPAAEGGKRTAGDAAGEPIDERTDFDALALWEPTVITDAAGRATIPFTLPDNLTRYRVMVVAVDGADHFGSDESTLTARLPLMVRPSAPRFANFGDRFELPVLVQNQTDTAMDVDLVLQTANLGAGSDAAARQAGRRVSVPANERIEVRFPVSAVEAGTARFRVAAVSGQAADAATVELPVYTPATTEAFATYGTIDDGAIAQNLLAPSGVIPQFGGLEITTSSTAVQALTDAVISVTDYPYESSDALASQILTISALRPVLDSFDAEGLPAPAKLDAAVNKAIEQLVALQNDDGGWSWWRRYERSEAFNSGQVMHALVMARQAGFTVPTGTFDRGLQFLQNVEGSFPAEIDEVTAAGLSAYALYVRNLAGDTDTGKAEGLFNTARDYIQPDAVAWLWPSIDDSALRAEIERLFRNAVVETAGAANFTTSYGDGAYMILSSDRRADGIILDAFITEQPTSDLIPKVVTGLLGSRVKGKWSNIQENTFILLALRNYFETFEAQTPEFVARAWLGQQYAGEQAFSGRQVDRATIAIPTDELISAGDSQIVLSKDGAGRLYYRLALRYAPDDLTVDPLDRGFVVQRSYEGVDDPADVVRNADGTWTFKAGARVRVTLTMVAESQRNQVALVDPLPAGLEILNTDLPITQELPPPAPGEGDVVPLPADRWWWGTWWNHTNQRDDRAEAFAYLLPAGTYSYSYVARATTPGTFVVPPTRAEEMYAPETFGRAASDTVTIA
jgi:hypothetical protein